MIRYWWFFFVAVLNSSCATVSERTQVPGTEEAGEEVKGENGEMKILSSSIENE